MRIPPTPPIIPSTHSEISQPGDDKDISPSSNQLPILPKANSNKSAR